MYTLQIDSHMRFAKNWDVEMINMVKQLQGMGIPKPLLTGYVSSFDPDNASPPRECKNRGEWRLTVSFLKVQYSFYLRLFQIGKSWSTPVPA